MIIWLVLLIAVLAWREVQILIDRGSWLKENLRFNPYWYIDQNSKKKILGLFPEKNFDSYHVSGGLVTLIIIYLIRDDLWKPIELSELLYVVAYWLIWMQIRNLFMKVIYKR